MTQFLKRGIALLLVLVSAFGLCACGAEQNSKDDASNETSTNGQETTTEQQNNVPFRVPSFQDTEVTLLSAEPYEDENVKIEITELEYSPAWIVDKGETEHGCCLIIHYKVENRSSQEMTLEAEMANINGFMCSVVDADDTVVQVGETKEIYAYIPAQHISKNCIEQIGNGNIIVRIYGDNFRKYRANLSFVARENFEQQKYTDGQVVYEKDGLKIVAQGHGEWVDAYSTFKNFDEHMRFYVENNSDKTYGISTQKYIHPDGYELDTPPFSNVIVQPGMKGYLFADVGSTYDKGITSIIFSLKVSEEASDEKMFYYHEVETFETEVLSIEPITIEERK